ncbi:MAG: cation-transporting P-type ATPase, partial [Hydrogenobacter thermophilus]|nr:cation-transporting P-type ATPase [Hydrogenobacter thermophilus]
MHHLYPDDVLSLLKTSFLGLSEEEAKRRYQQYGANQLTEEEESKWRVLLRQFTSPFIVILMVAGF